MTLGPLSNFLNPLGVARRISPLKDRLVAWWALDEAAGAQRNDSHTNGYHLSDVNTVGQTTGILDNAALFVRAGNDKLRRASNSDLAPGNVDFTFATWIKISAMPSSGSFPNILAKDDTAAGGRSYLLIASYITNAFRWSVSANGTSIVNLSWSSTITLNTWYFVLCWHDSVNDQIGMRVNNGTPVTLSHSAGVWSNAVDFSIGAASNVGGGTTIDAAIDNTAMWKRLLTTDEQNFLYNSGAGRRYSEL